MVSGSHKPLPLGSGLLTDGELIESSYFNMYIICYHLYNIRSSMKVEFGCVKFLTLLLMCGVSPPDYNNLKTQYIVGRSEQDDLRHVIPFLIDKSS